MTEGLRRMGADVQATEDGMIITGGKPLHGAVIDPAADHRAAMSFAVASLAAGGTTTITDEQCVAISYPTFFADLSSLSGGQI
jgi:3-phosphoshikimate 1-carboxyvinyltransferase